MGLFLLTKGHKMRLSDRLQPTTKHNPCPICGNTSGKCRTKDNDEQAVLCAGTTARKGDREGQYVCTNDKGKGHTSHTFVLSNENYSEWDEQRKVEYQLEKQRRTLLAEQERQARIASEVSIEVRDRVNRQIVEQLHLNQTDRQHLLDRGFTLQQIEQCMYRSVSQWQRVELDGCPVSFPGLVTPGFGDTNIRKMVVSSAGILCPVIEDGKIVAFKVRLTNAVDGQRYKAVSSSTASYHVNGEQPLAVLHPAGFCGDDWLINLFVLLNRALYFPPYSRGIWVTEGNEIKPVLLNQKQDVAVLGGGRYWHRSPNHADYLPMLQALYGDRIVLCPDAGDILNPMIYPHWIAEAEWFESQGLEVRFAWWGQISKDCCDIDELNDLTDIEYLTLSEFRTLTEEYNSEEFREWRESRKFTPTITVNDPDGFHFPQLPTTNAIISVKAGMGRGKTKALLGLMKESPNRSYVFGCLNNLLTQTEARGEEIGVRIYHLINDDAKGLIPDTNTNITCCVDSMYHLDGYFAGTDIYLDEIASIIAHILGGGTLREKQALTMAIFEKAVRECNRVFNLDANNTDLITTFISSIDPSKEVVKILDTAKSQLQTFKIVDGYNHDKERRNARDRSPLVEVMCEPEVKPFIASDSRELTNTYTRILTDAGKRGFVLNRDTVRNEESSEFLHDPDAFLDKHQPDFYAISPTANSGVSITNANYFTHKVTIFTGVLATNQQTQILGRLRPTHLEHLIACPESSTIGDIATVGGFADRSLLDITRDKIGLSARISSSSEEMKQRLHAAIENNWNDKWFQLSMVLGKYDQYERNNLRKCLMWALREQGHRVEVIDMNTSDGYKALENGIKEELRLTRATEVHTAVPFDSVDEANRVAKTSPTPEVMRRIEKTRLLDRLPGIDLTNVFTPELLKTVLYDDRDAISNLQRYFFLQNFDISQKRSEVNWYYKATGQYFYLGSMARDSHLRVWALQQLGVKSILDALLAGEEVHKDHKIVTNLYTATVSSYDVRVALGVHVPKATLGGKERTDLLKTVLKMVGVKLKKVGRKEVGKTLVTLKNRGVNTVPIRRNHYAVDMEDYTSAERMAILEAIERKYRYYLESETVKKVRWKPDPPPEVKGHVAFIREYMDVLDWSGYQTYFAPVAPEIQQQVWLELTNEERHHLEKLEPMQPIEQAVKELLDSIQSGTDISPALVTVRDYLITSSEEERVDAVNLVPRRYRHLLTA